MVAIVCILLLPEGYGGNELAGTLTRSAIYAALTASVASELLNRLLVYHMWLSSWTVAMFDDLHCMMLNLLTIQMSSLDDDNESYLI
ncbi:hypothetical protein QVD17_06255 [Tagetes erecta]|uniref:Uncharacterized protein n=1 Tax=Tagetes erecta TaxID=13708 RepID=A0AAD8LFP6_TARER|nr:hypothetical protein QVD17_06255 [Tagetes erecta]